MRIVVRTYLLCSHHSIIRLWLKTADVEFRLENEIYLFAEK